MNRVGGKIHPLYHLGIKKGAPAWPPVALKLPVQPALGYLTIQVTQINTVASANAKKTTLRPIVTRNKVFSIPRRAV
jgi:hypothetical protein